MAARAFWLSVLVSTCCAGAFAYPRPISGTAVAKEPLVSTAQITGDVIGGFRVSCMVVYSDGQFHRELHRQVSRNGHPQPEWESATVVEGNIDTPGMEQVRSIIETSGFRDITGVVGNPRTLPMLVYWPGGAVTPYSDIDVLTVSVAHPQQPQVFEISDFGAAQHKEPLPSFLDWLKDTERRQGLRRPSAAANNCSLSPVPASLPTGFTPPSPINPKPSSGSISSRSKSSAVKVEIVINPDGTVGQPRIMTRTSTEVEKKVLDTLKEWKFQPARLLGVPVGVKVEIDGTF